MNDLKFAIRQLVKNPGFTAVAVLSLSLGIAANTAIFSFVNELLLRPPPVEKPGELWQVWREHKKTASTFARFQGLSYPGYVHFRDNNKSFVSLAGFDPETPFVSWNRGGIGHSIQCQFVSGNFFSVCGVRPAMGRVFQADEDRVPGEAPVAVISHAFWKNKLASDPSAIGQALAINGVNLTVIGVAPPGFKGLIAGLAPDFWAPYMMAPVVLHDPEWHTRTGSFSHFGAGRLRPGATPAQAQAELTALIRGQEAAEPRHNQDYNAAIFPSTMVPSPFRSFVSAFTGALMAAVAMVLLIACANTANLMLARAVARRREIAVRAALGASRWRLTRQILTESVLLGLISGAIGLFLAYLLLPALLKLSPPTLPIRPEVGLDANVFAFVALASVAAGILFGLAPAWRGLPVNLISTLKEGSQGADVRRARFASALVIGQIAVCLALLIGGSLCLRSLLNAHRVRLGFKIENRITAEVNLKDYGYTADEMRAFNTAFLERAAARPEFEAVAIADYLPLDARFLGLGYNIEDHEPPPDQQAHNFQTFDVGHDYFSAMGTTLLRGREFAVSDNERGSLVAIVNQDLADRFWPGQDSVGQRLYEGPVGTERSYEIVGVVETGKYRSLGESPRPVVFRSRFQHPRARSTFVAHARGDAAAALAAFREITRSLDSRLSLSRLETLDRHLALSLFPARASGLLFGVCGLLALVLAVCGLFGVIAYSVSQRTREIGIRMAVGAKSNDILRMILRQGLKLAVAGSLLGLIGAFLGTPLLRSLLLGVEPADPITFAAVPLLLIGIASLACLVPALRATRVDPLTALRSE